MNTIYKQLVDLYAGCELTEELESDMEAAAASDPSLAQDMTTLRATVTALKESPAPEFSEESHQRILMRIYAKGIEIQTQTPDASYLQYQLPMQG